MRRAFMSNQKGVFAYQRDMTLDEHGKSGDLGTC